MKKTFLTLPLLILALAFVVSCGDSKKTNDDTDTTTDEPTDTTDEPTDSTDAALVNCGNHELDEGEVCDGNATECSTIDSGYTGGYAVCNNYT